jgi:hypothetical protein
VAAALEHPPRQAGQDLESPLVDIVERELVERQQLAHADQPVHEFWRVRRSAADDRELQTGTSGVTSPFARATSA